MVLFNAVLLAHPIKFGMQEPGRATREAHLLAVAWLRVFALNAVDESGLLGVEAVQLCRVLVDEGVVLICRR